MITANLPIYCHIYKSIDSRLIEQILLRGFRFEGYVVSEVSIGAILIDLKENEAKLLINGHHLPSWLSRLHKYTHDPISFNTRALPLK